MKKINLLFINLSLSIISILFALFISEFFLNKLSKKETVFHSFDKYIRLVSQPSNIKREFKPSNVYIQHADGLNINQKYLMQTDETGAIVNPEDKNTFYNNLYFFLGILRNF